MTFNTNELAQLGDVPFDWLLRHIFVARKSWAFDHIYFNQLDEKFFSKIDGEGDWLAHQLPLLTEKQRRAMKLFVQRKMAQRANQKLADRRFDSLL